MKCHTHCSVPVHYVVVVVSTSMFGNSQFTLVVAVCMVCTVQVYIDLEVILFGFLSFIFLKLHVCSLMYSFKA